MTHSARVTVAAVLAIAVAAAALGADQVRPVAAAGAKAQAGASAAATAAGPAGPLSPAARKVAPLMVARPFERAFPSTRMRYRGDPSVPKALLSDVHYTLSGKLKKVPDGTLAGTDMTAPSRVVTLPGGQYQPGSIVYDPGSQKVVALLESGPDGKFLYGAPPFDQVFDDFVIPEQDLPLTVGNIERSVVPIRYVPMPDAMRRRMNERKAIPLAPSQAAKGDAMADSSVDVFPAVRLDFDGGSYEATLPSGGTIGVNISGSLTISDISIHAKYTAFKGYKFSIVTGEEVSLTVKATLQMREEAYIPVLALDIPFGIGHLRGGVYLIAGIDGNAELAVALTEGLALEGGVRGGTFCYIPSGPLPFLTPSGFHVGCEPSFEGEIQAGLFVAPVLQVELLGVNLLAAEMRLGAGLSVKTASDNAKLLEVIADARLYAFFDVLGERFELVNERWDLFTRRQKKTGGYYAALEEADAYRDLVAGVLKPERAGIGGFNGNVQIMLAASGGSGSDAHVATAHCSNGVFRKSISYNLRKGQTLYLKYTTDAGNDGYSEPIATTFPFRDIKIDDADYYNDTFSGSVAAAQVSTGTDRPGLLEFTGKATVRIVDDRGVLPTVTRELPVNGGKFSTSFPLLPFHSAHASIVWDGDTWVTAAPVKPRNGLAFVWSLSRRGERDGGMTYYLRGWQAIDDYCFLNFYLYNTKNVKTVIAPDVTGAVHLVMPAVTRTDWLFGERVDWRAEPVPDSSHPLAFTLKKNAAADGAAWTDLYVYRWRRPVGNATPPDSATAAGGTAQGAPALRSPDGLTASRSKASESGESGQGKMTARGTASEMTAGRSRGTGVGRPRPIGHSNRVLDVRDALVEEINESGEVPAFTQERAREWAAFTADYEDADQFDHNGFALVDGNAGNGFAGFLVVSACYTYEDAESCAVGWAGSLPRDWEYSSNPSPEPAQESPRAEGYIEGLLKEKEGLLTHPDPDVQVSMERLKAKYTAKPAAQLVVANAAELPSFAASSVATVVGWGAMDVQSNGAFPAGRPITGGELLAGVVRLFDLNAKAGAPRYRDVRPGYRYFREASVACALGLVAADGDELGVERALTREQAAVVLDHALEAVLGTRKVGAGTRRAPYSDAAAISPAGRAAVARVASLGLLDSFAPSGAFKPVQPMTMAEAATVLDRVARRFIVVRR